MLDISLLKQICQCPGAPGFEHVIRNFLMKVLAPMGFDLQVDPIGNLIVFKKGTISKKLMFSAHMDEIGFIVNHIDDDGFLRFLPLGGFDPKTLSAQRVIIHGKTDVIGVMGCKPIHLMSDEEKTKVVQIKDYFIDTGLSSETVRQTIEVGNAITRERELILMGDCINAKSLDNRISVYILVEFLKSIANESISPEIYGVFTVQEEVGLRGAKSAAFRIGPDYAVNIDTTIANDVPGSQAHEVITKLGNGVGIKLYDSSVLPDYRMVRFLKDCAENAIIKWQPELLPRGGTDTQSIQLSGNGCIAGAISIPTRHIHQAIEMVNSKDVTAAIQLLKEITKRIDSYNWNFN